jgi:hypothetical protein
MKLRIHFATGQTAMTKTVDINETFRGFCNTLERNNRDGTIVRFMGDGAFAIAARSIVLVEELT